MDAGSSEKTPKHPAGYKLDAMAAGDNDASVAAHLETCAQCSKYVSDLRAQAARYDGEAAARGILARARAENVLPLRRPWSANLMRVAVVAGPVLAAAAAVGLLV